MLIEVTKDHIKNGIQECEMDCPIALAVCRAAESELDDDQLIKANVIAVVHDSDISVHYHKPNTEMDFMYSLEPLDPIHWKIISDFIHHFDSNKHDVEPFNMEFEVIQD